MLELKNITKDYEGKPLLKGVSFDVVPGETVCLLGPSGSGKSTLLRIISGLETADSGEVYWQGKDLAGIPVHLRNFGLMFQDYALFPHKNVFDNVAFALKMQKLPRVEIEERVETALRKVGMEEFTSRRVTDLSGGEQQRVAFARSLAPRPGLLMLDEPLGALDRSLKEQLMDDLRHLLHETGIPAIYVTHDQEEAFTIADRLLLLHDGQIVQQGTPADVFSHPNSIWTARFLGMKNFVKGKIIQSDPVTIQTVLGKFKLTTTPIKNLKKDQPVQLLINSNAAKSTEAAAQVNSINGIVVDTVFRGDNYKILISCCEEQQLEFIMGHPLKVGQNVHLSIDPEGLEYFDK